MPIEQLTAEKAQIRSRKTTTALFIGVLFGVAIYAAVNGSFLLSIGLMVAGVFIGKRTAQQLGRIQAEISRRSTAG